ncbi:MAG: hypothetical protein IJ565_02925 [Bacilli bacterium]|nr:hypothetical protein [Bacilli bacterium]
MKDKDILNMLGLTDRTITLGLDDEYLQITLEKKIDDYLKKLDEKREKQKRIDTYKQEYENFKEKKKYIDMFKDTFVYGKIKDTLIRDGFIYRCPFCLDVSNQYGRPIETYKNHNHCK